MIRANSGTYILASTNSFFDAFVHPSRVRGLLENRIYISEFSMWLYRLKKEGCTIVESEQSLNLLIDKIT